MAARSSAVSRGFRVWQTAPMPVIAYQASKCAWVFQARVATRSPILTPSPANTDETRWLRAISAP